MNILSIFGQPVFLSSLFPGFGLVPVLPPCGSDNIPPFCVFSFPLYYPSNDDYMPSIDELNSKLSMRIRLLWRGQQLNEFCCPTFP